MERYERILFSFTSFDSFSDTKSDNDLPDPRSLNAKDVNKSLASSGSFSKVLRISN